MTANELNLEAYERTIRSLDKTVPDSKPGRSAQAALAQQLVADGKGILAADESNGTANKRLRSVDVSPSPETRRSYRQMLLSTPGLHEHISGVILYDETIRQRTDDGTNFADLLNEQGIVPGIKVDTGTVPLAGHPGEKITSGLAGLRDRLAEYWTMGARFAKWRAVISISEHQPSVACLDANAHAMARYAVLSQESGFVPIVEPEVVMDGDHGIERDLEVTTEILRRSFDALLTQGATLEGLLLKTNMVLPGEDAAERPTPDQVAKATLACLRRSVPTAVPGVVFLSGGQSAQDATARLNAINAAQGPAPWKLSFSYGRALQGPSLKTWAQGAPEADRAQSLLVHRARCNGAATTASYDPAMEKERAPA